MSRAEIPVVSGVGTGATELDAFDAALGDAGLADYNLVPLSSVIPPDATVVTRETFAADGDLSVGDPVAVVLARATTDADGPVAAGLGWAVAPEGGVFFEAARETVEECRREIGAALDGARARRDWDWAPDDGVRTAVTDARGPSAAVVVAVYGRLALDPLPPDG